MVRPQKAKRLHELVGKAEKILSLAQDAEFNYIDGNDNFLGTRLHFLSIAITQMLRATAGIKMTDAEQSMVPNPPKMLERAKSAVIPRKSKDLST